MSEPYYADDGVTLWHGDCLDVLADLPDASVDAVVTDPPYNLSTSAKRDKKCLREVVSEILLPRDEHDDTERGEGVHLATPALRGADLRGEDWAVRVDAGVGVPEGAVHFEHPTVVQDEVGAGDEPAALATDGDLPLEGDSLSFEFGGDLILQSADDWDATFCNGTCRCFTEPSPGFIAVSVVVPRLAGGNRSGVRLVVEGRDANVGVRHDAGRQAECPTGVHAGGGAEDRAVLRLDLRGGTGELDLTDRTLDNLTPFQLARAEGIGAGAGAGRLSPVAQPYRVRVVDGTAGRAFTLHHVAHVLNSSTGGFMGREWDGWENPAAFQRWCTAWTAECLRVLKPGGMMLAFGGTRTWHRLACAIEDAGFEVRDSIAWLYGCLSDDTEILTSEGWAQYDRAKEGQRALAFDTATGALAWQAIQHVHRYPYAGEMVRLHSEHTDQLLTPNHRVVLDEDRPTPHTPYVPSDQDLRRLLADVPGARPLPVGAEADVLARVRGAADLAAEEGQDQASRRAGGPHGAVRDLRDGDVEAGRMAQSDHGGVLLEPVQRFAPGRGVGEALPQGQGGLDRRQPGVLPGEDDRAEQPRMEGRSYRVQEARELCRSAVRASAGMGATDGPQGRIHHGAPATDGRPLRVPADQAGSHQSREPRPQGQPTGEPDPLAVEPGAQALRVGEDGGGRLLPSTRVTADVVDYAGVVWCITVPHGAFIARRNGLIFATGNSGFPKSMNVSKSIDKAAGAEREASGERGSNACTYLDRGEPCPGHGDAGQSMSGATVHRLPTTPATPDADRWQGWGTALKPAFEPIVVARKPLAGTVAANVLEHGTGALNIDGCRVGGEFTSGWSKSGSKASENDSMSGPNYARDPKPDNPAGRWPTNVVLDDTQAAVLDEQSGELSSGANPTRRGSDKFRDAYGDFKGQEECTPARGADTGGASRFFPTFRYEAKAPTSERPKVNGTAHPTVKPLDLMRWLVRLVTPPGGTVLEPFAGSGTTVEACIVEGFHCIAIEREAEYLPLIEQRIYRRRDPVAAIRLAGDDLGLFDTEKPA